eukprot:7504349-Prorocentrum_lima.AAC.1
MTSSLVGSEMCIRDRVGWLVWLAGCVAGWLAGWLAVWVGVCVCVWEVMAVSYTHLTLPTICSV